jgi:hypothetical protein
LNKNPPKQYRPMDNDNSEKQKVCIIMWSFYEYSLTIYLCILAMKWIKNLNIINEV